jgi:hypothetical protein
MSSEYNVGDRVTFMDDHRRVRVTGKLERFETGAVAVVVDEASGEEHKVWPYVVPLVKVAADSEEVAEGVRKHGALFREFAADNADCDPSRLMGRFAECYMGAFDSMADYVRQELGKDTAFQGDAQVSWILDWVDYEALGAEWERNDIKGLRFGGKVHVFDYSN